MRDVHRVVGGRVRYVLTAHTQPFLHELDLVCLRGVDEPGYVDQLGSIRAIGHQLSHLEGLMMVRDHVVHEPHVGRRVTGIGDLDRLLGAEFPPSLTRRTRLDDGHLGHDGACWHQQNQTQVDPPKLSSHSSYLSSKYFRMAPNRGLSRNGSKSLSFSIQARFA